MGAFVGADPAARIGPAGGEASFVPKRAEGRKAEGGGIGDAFPELAG